MVDVVPIAKAVDRWRRENLMSWADVARELGWMRGEWGDTMRVKKALGLYPDHTHRKSILRKRIREETALKFIRLIDRAPWEFDL